MRSWLRTGIAPSAAVVSLGGFIVEPGAQNCLSGEVEADQADRIYTGENEQDWFGKGVAGLGDILGDPSHEAVILAGRFAGADEGKTYVVHQSDADPYFHELLFGSHGHAVAPAGDVDNDGTLDFIVGGNVTKVYSGADGSVIVSFAAQAPGDKFGNGVTGIGDLDGNGYDDVAVGAPLNTEGTGETTMLFPQAGRVYVFLTDPAPPATPIPAAQADLIFTGNPGDWLGWDIASGDVNGDGTADLIMTALYARTVPAFETLFGGKAYIYLMSPLVQGPLEFGAGETALDEDVHVAIVQDDQSAFFGWTVDAGRDFDSGGRQDIIIGTYKWREAAVGNQDTGKAYIYYGEDFILPQAEGPGALVVDSESARVGITGRQDALPFGGGEGSISFGYDVAFAGDVNGDGFPDVVVGAPYYDEGIDPQFPFLPDLVDNGAAYLYYGTGQYTSQIQLTSEQADLELKGTNEGDLFGWSVAGHGFADSPTGFEDLIIGAPGFDNARGRVYTFFVCRECPADVTGDGAVNVLDLIQLLLCFGQPASAGCEAEDVNGDGDVNVLDLIQLLLEFGQACL